jgi:hypothetical protein
MAGIVSEILDEDTVTFTIPAGAGSYAPEKLQLTHATLALSVIRCVIDVELPAGATIEGWLLKLNGNSALDADYVFAFSLLSGTLRFQASSLYARAIQLRAKSGGTGGTVVCHALVV